jgi:hypothetical protein
MKHPDDSFHHFSQKYPHVKAVYTINDRCLVFQTSKKRFLNTSLPWPAEVEVDYEKLLVKRNAPRWISKLRKYGHLPVYL